MDTIIKQLINDEKLSDIPILTLIKVVVELQYLLQLNGKDGIKDVPKSVSLE